MTVLVVEEDEIDDIIRCSPCLINADPHHVVGEVGPETIDLLSLLGDPLAKAFVCWALDVAASLAIEALERTQPEVAVVEVLSG